MTAAELTAPLVRKDKEKRIVYGPVLIPGEPDSDGDVVKAEKIEDVAHRFVEEYGNIDLMHSLKNVGRVVESYIAPVDLHFDDVTVPKGSWMMGVRVTDDETWNLVKKGRLTGFSIMGMRSPALKGLGDNPSAEKILAAVKRTTLADLGDDWFVNFVSLVDEPAVPRAKFLVIKSKGDTGDPKNWWERIKNKIAKAASGATDLPLADRNRAWDSDAAEARVRKWASSDGSGDKEKINWSRYRQAFFWYDENNPENFGSYKLPFADVIDGRLMAVPRGIIAAAQAIQGARGGVNIPAEDVDDVKRRIAAYYKKMDDEPPWSEKSKGGDDMTREEIVAAMKEAMDGMAEAIGEAVRAAMKEAKQDAAKDDGQDKGQGQKDQQPAPDANAQDGGGDGNKDDKDKKDGSEKDDVVQLSRAEYEELVNRIQEIETAVGKAKGFGLFFGSNRLVGQDGGDAPAAAKRKPDRDMFGRVIKRKDDE